MNPARLNTFQLPEQLKVGEADVPQNTDVLIATIASECILRFYIWRQESIHERQASTFRAEQDNANFIVFAKQQLKRVFRREHPEQRVYLLLHE